MAIDPEALAASVRRLATLRRVIIERGVGYLMARDQVDSMIAFDRAPPSRPRHPKQDRRRGPTAGVDRPAADRDLSISEPLISHHK
jgi:hypothetical protein